MIGHLLGLMFGAWIMKNGAASAILVGVTLSSTIIPILGFLPRSAACSPKSGDIKQSVAASTANSTSEGASSVASLLLPPEQPGTKDLLDPERQVSRPHELDSLNEESKDTFSKLIRRFSYIPFDNPLYLIYLAVMFVKGVAMDVLRQLRPWTSKRYHWPLATVGYILGVENFLGVGILFALPWLDRARRPRPRSLAMDTHTSVSADIQSDSAEEAIKESREILTKRRREILVARVSLGLAAGGALMLVLAANRAAFVIGLAVMTCGVGFPEAIRAFFTSYFATGDIQGLYASVTVVESLSVIVGSPIWGQIFAHSYQGASAWMGAPFGVCAVLLLFTLGLLLALRV